MDKRALSERDICTKFITPALRQAGWDGAYTPLSAPKKGRLTRGVSSLVFNNWEET